MTRTDYYAVGLTSLNLFFLLQILTTFDISNFTALFNYKMLAGYISLTAAIAGILFVLRNLTRAVMLVSGNDTDVSKFIRVTSFESLLVIISFIVLSLSNTTIFYLFNEVM